MLRMVDTTSYCIRVQGGNLANLAHLTTSRLFMQHGALPSTYTVKKRFMKEGRQIMHFLSLTLKPVARAQELRYFALSLCVCLVP